MFKRLLILPVLALVASPIVVSAQAPRNTEAPYLFESSAIRPGLPAQAPAAPGARTEAPKDAYVDRAVDTPHVTRVGGQEIRYTATVGSLGLADDAGKVRAHQFFVAYTKDGADAATRPVTFCYNGGPGSASVWLHMGTIGPKKVQMADEGFQPSPPFKLVDNEETLLDVTDIVMIDAMGTGYSRVAAGEDARQFYGSTPDIQTFGEFIRSYITKYKRWPSPKFLLGESYGTTRSAGLSAELQQRHGIELNGIVLVSAVVDFGSQEYAPGHDLAYSTYLPTLTATAWYHKKLPADLQAMPVAKVVAEAKTFAMGDYLVALAKGNRLTDAERQATAAKLARFTGLSQQFILNSHLRVTDTRFRKELLRDKGVMVGRLDGRFTGLDSDAAGERQEFDPSNTALQGAYTALFSDYVRRELKYETDMQYATSASVRPWSYAEFQNRYVNMMEPLRSAMARNPFLKVFVANGYYDMATPFFSTEYTFDHIGFEPTYRERVSMGFYEAGHMMYIRPSAQKAFKKDVAEFIKTNSTPR